MSGKILNLYVKPGHGAAMREMTEISAVDNMGLVDDISYGRNKRQVLLIDQETLSEYGLAPGQLRENVAVSGVVLTGLAKGTQILLGQVSLEVTGDCAPCHQVEAIRPGLREAMSGRRGILCRVLTGGTIKVGDSVSLR